MAKMYGKAGHWDWCDDLGSPRTKRIARRKKSQRIREDRLWQEDFIDEATTEEDEG